MHYSLTVKPLLLAQAFPSLLLLLLHRLWSLPHDEAIQVLSKILRSLAEPHSRGGHKNKLLIISSAASVMPFPAA